MWAAAVGVAGKYGVNAKLIPGGVPWVGNTNPEAVYVYSYSMLRNSASGLAIGLPGRILAGLIPGKHRNRPSGRKADFRPGSTIA